MKTLKEGNHILFGQNETVTKKVSEMLLNIEKNGMDAVRKYSNLLDNWNPDSFELNEGQIQIAIDELDQQVIKDTDYCQKNVRDFANAQMKTMTSLEVEIRPEMILGHRHIPVDTVGSYIPGGRYPMFGSAQMSIIPAKVAGVKTVQACTPPVKGKGYYPATINAMKKAGADRILIIGGVQAMAMMAFGLDGLKEADILCGAGNQYVAEAKRQLYGKCGIDLLAGPTEILVIADESADPALVACDLLGQAEHDPNSGICLICLSEDFGLKTIQELEKQLAVLPTKDIAALSWASNGIVIVAESVQEAIDLSDQYAPEHLEIHVKDLDFYFGKLKNYGSIFIGEETTVAYGDKSIGTNHILPTSRAARYTGGVWVGKFLKTCTYQRISKRASREIALVTERQCKVENMLAHGITAQVRAERYAKDKFAHF